MSAIGEITRASFTHAHNVTSPFQVFGFNRVRLKTSMSETQYTKAQLFCRRGARLWFLSLFATSSSVARRLQGTPCKRAQGPAELFPTKNQIRANERDSGNIKGVAHAGSRREEQ